MAARRSRASLVKRFPPSPPCRCGICLGYCIRPGWWTVVEAAAAIEAGYARRMMLELSPDRSFAVISPAFDGCQCGFATQAGAKNGCNFLLDGLCELYHSGHMPLECRFCHHDRAGQGQACHDALERDWRTPAGQALVKRWSRTVGLWGQVQRYLSPC